jgi:ABC-2 type transport system ATP-binding protein
MTAVIEARGLQKSYGATRALDGVSFTIQPGRIVGLIGPNGAGKTSALKAILGLTPFGGELHVLGLDPRSQRDALMREVCFMADVAVLPRWLKVWQALDYVQHVTRASTARSPRISSARPTSSARAASASSPRAWSRSCTWR